MFVFRSHCDGQLPQLGIWSRSSYKRADIFIESIPAFDRASTKHLIAMMHVVTMVTLAHSETAAIQLGCDGQMIEPTAKTSSPRTMQMKIASDKVEVGNVPAQVESKNAIQFKFKTPEFVGEYFYYTGDLILIYKSGHLARLTCKQH
jgi:hypothetical protein